MYISHSPTWLEGRLKYLYPIKSTFLRLNICIRIRRKVKNSKEIVWTYLCIYLLFFLSQLSDKLTPPTFTKYLTYIFYLCLTFCNTWNVLNRLISLSKSAMSKNRYTSILNVGVIPSCSFLHFELCRDITWEL
jgi:hypothetical protein